MRLFSIFSLLFCLISCQNSDAVFDDKSSSGKVVIPQIEKDRKDVLFALKNGVLFYDEALYSGIVQEYYRDGSLKSSAEYYQGKREGKYFGFYPNQNIWFQRFYENGFKVNTHKGWFSNGVQMFEYQFNTKGVYNGYVKDWHSNGQLAKHFNFVNGVEVGSQKMWKPSGKIRANFFTVKGERHGLIGLKNCVSVITSTSN